VITESLTSQNFTFANVTVNNADSDIVTQYLYTATLSNGAEIMIFFSQYINATTITFANQTVDVPTNGLKYGMSISNWPFLSYYNKLQILVDVTASSLLGSSDCQVIQTQVDDSLNLQWIKISLNGQSLYGTFNPLAIIDSEAKTVQFSFDTTYNYTVVTVPHFWYSVEFDPSFQVLVDSSAPSVCLTDGPEYTVTVATGVNTVVVGAVTGSVVGAVIIFGGAFFGFRYQKKRRLRSRFQKTIELVNRKSAENANSVLSDSSLRLVTEEISAL